MISILRSIIEFYYLKKLNCFIIYNNGNLSPKEENIIKDTRNLFRLKKEQNYAAVKDIRNLFRLKKEIKEIKDIVLRNIKNICLYGKEENDYKPVRENIFWSNNYIEYKSNGGKNKILSVKEYLNRIRP